MANTNRMPTDSRELLKRARKLGCEVIPGGKHLKISYRGRVVATIASTPSDGRTVMNTAHDLRRAGIDLRLMRVTL